MLSETTTVRPSADLADEVQEWGAAVAAGGRERGWPVASKVAAPAMTLISPTAVTSPCGGDGQEAMEGPGDMWISALVTAFTVPVLTECGLVEQAGAASRATGERRTGATPIHNTVRHAEAACTPRPRPAAAPAAAAAGERAERWGVRIPR